MVLCTDGQIAHDGHDSRCFHISRHPFAIDFMESSLLKEYGPDDVYLIPVILALSHVLPDSLRTVDFAFLLIALHSRLPDLRLALTEPISQENLGSFVRDNRFVIVPDRTGFEGEVGRLLGLNNVVTQEHLGVKVRRVPGYLV